MDEYDFLSRAARDTETDFREAVLATERETLFEARGQHADLDRAAAAARDELVAYVVHMNATALRVEAAAAGVVVTPGGGGSLRLSGAVTAKVYSDRQALEFIRNPKLTSGSAAARLTLALTRLFAARMAESKACTASRLPWVDNGSKVPWQSGGTRETADLLLTRREAAAWASLVTDLAAEKDADRWRRRDADEEEDCYEVAA